MVTQSALWLCIGSGVIIAMFTAFWAFGRKHRVEML